MFASFDLEFQISIPGLNSLKHMKDALILTPPRKIFTGGSDSLVRDFNTSLDLRGKDRNTATKHSDPVTCIATNKDSIFTGSEDKSVARFDVHNLAFQSIVMKCPTAVRCMALQPQQSGQRGQEQLLAIGSEDAIVRILNSSRGTVTPLPSLRHAPSSLAFHPDGKSLVSWDGSTLTPSLRLPCRAPWRYSTLLGPSPPSTPSFWPAAAGWIEATIAAASPSTPSASSWQSLPPAREIFC